MVFEGEQKEKELLTKVRREEEENRVKLLAEKFDLPYLNLAFIPIESDALKLIPKEKAQKAKAAIINREVKTLHLAVLNPDNKETQSLIAELQKSGYAIKIFVVSENSLEKAFSQYPPLKEIKEITGQVEISNEALVNLQKEISDIKTLKQVLEDLFKAKASQIVEATLAGALILKASDIHFEPEKENVRVRLRLDGLLEDITYLPTSIYPLLLNRIKLLSGLKLNIREKAQDGRFSIVSGGNAIEIRTSVLPGAYGENIVMRILDPRVIKINLEDLGIRGDDLAIINQELQKPTGMILTTGPTGSGKTTTLYAFIKKILTPDIKIITIEDPVEYHIEGISQTQVEPDKGYTFENGLRSIVRQDPDIILVGEIRDYETAEIAMHAALTGHLVFSTLHTNDAVGAIPRLIDLGVKPPVIAPAINLLMAQRLLRRVCSKCAKKRLITTAELKDFKKILNNLPARVKLEKELNEKTQISEHQGCQNCHNGYAGRIAVLELFEVDDQMEDLILKSPTETQIKTAAEKAGFVTMMQDAVIKIISGVTTIEETERVLGMIEGG
ncbi:MAG: type II/IV secretion system protein [Candidatus Azambacteria bacterium]|nr:type II/IV secretion system protein [Candidatus Azambacteria bacterium]